MEYSMFCTIFPSYNWGIRATNIASIQKLYYWLADCVMACVCGLWKMDRDDRLGA
jgi:hypothetical protein